MKVIKSPRSSSSKKSKHQPFSTHAKMSARTTHKGGKMWYDEIWKTVDKCVFCDLKDKYIVAEIDGMVLTMNIFPYIDGHLMIVSRRHVRFMKELTNKEWLALKKLQYLATKLIRTHLKIKDTWTLYREGSPEVACSTVEHFHMHIIPIVKGMFEWNYQKITKEPERMARVYRGKGKFIKDVLEKYEKRYGE